MTNQDSATQADRDGRIYVTVVDGRVAIILPAALTGLPTDGPFVDDQQIAQAIAEVAGDYERGRLARIGEP